LTIGEDIGQTDWQTRSRGLVERGILKVVSDTSNNNAANTHQGAQEWKERYSQEDFQYLVAFLFQNLARLGCSQEWILRGLREQREQLQDASTW